MGSLSKRLVASKRSFHTDQAFWMVRAVGEEVGVGIRRGILGEGGE